MADIFRALFIVVAGLTVFVGALGALYFATFVLPQKRRNLPQIVVFLGPVLLLVFVSLVIPTVRTVIASFQSDDGKSFVGFSNYRSIFDDHRQLSAIINTLLWVVFGGTLSTFFGLTIARFADGIKRESVAKALVFIPVALSLAGAGIIWKFVYDGPPFEFGLLNAITERIPGWPKSFGGDGQMLWLLEESFRLNTLLLIVILIWVQTGFAVVVLSAAVKGVPESLQEAATVDGASRRQVFYKVTLPYIRPALLTVATTNTLASLKALDIVQGAGSGGQSETGIIASQWYSAWLNNREGIAASLAILFFVIGLPIVIVNRIGQKRAQDMVGA
jgi:alpha-glucoside transport system permease protein